jgi:hypothetical protein
MSEHWYDRNGRPCYEQRAKSGLPRATTLADARKLGLVPSVTTVLAVLDKPALTNWKVDQGILAALTLPRNPGETELGFLRRVKEDSQAQAKAAAEEGTRIHDACECSMQNRWFPEQYAPHVLAVEAELRRLFPGVTDWRAEDSFGHSLGFGGKVDLHSPSTGIVVDYKGKDGDFTDGKRLAYDQHYQLAAYQNGLCLPRNVCANIFVSRTHPGAVASHVWKADEIEEGWRVFTAALAVWKALRRFDSSYPQAAEAA